MSLAAESRQHAETWFRIAKRLPEQTRRPALEVAEAWFELAMSAAAIEAGQRNPTLH
jgi:hypothetical protein